MATKKNKFPSPFGVHVLKRKQSRAIESLDSAFPSPFGVHVLKTSACNP